MKILLIMICMFTMATTGLAETQATAPSPATTEANGFWQAQKWEEAARAYESITKAEPANGQAWFRYGSSLMSLNKFQESIPPLAKAAEVLNGPVVYYTLASSYAKIDNKEKAFESLTKAASLGFAQLNRLKSDPNLAAIRGAAQFNAVFEAVEKNAKPCKHLPEAKQFDFWVGEWDVQVGGQTIGSNSIQRLQEGCLIMENWTGNGGQTGMGMNFFNPVTKKWRQTYMSSTQVVWEMSGEYKDGAIRYEGEINARGGRTLTRVTFFNLSPEKIRHTEDNSSDAGKTWTNVWDAMYVRKKTP